MGRIGGAYQSLGLYPQAEHELRRAWELRCASLGREHLQTAERLAHLASLLQEMRSPEEAEPLTREALAKLYLRQQDAAAAEPLCAEALRIQRTSRDPYHTDIADCLETLARIRAALGDATGEEELAQEAVRIRNRPSD